MVMLSKGFLVIGLCRLSIDDKSDGIPFVGVLSSEYGRSGTTSLHFCLRATTSRNSSNWHLDNDAIEVS